MEYKGYKIEPHSYFKTGYEAYKIDDDEAEVLSGRTMEEILATVDDKVD